MIPAVLVFQMDRLDPGWVWDRFARDLGPQQLKDCYGWAAPPVELRPTETAWIYREPEYQQLIGWGSLIKDPTMPTYWHTSGVCPAFQRQGYRQAIRQHLCGEAFARGAEAVSLVVLDGNREHRERCHREDTAGSPWKFSGRIWSPEPGQWIFTLLRKDWAQTAIITSKAQISGDVGPLSVVDLSPSLLAREKVCCCFHLHMPDSEPACGLG